MRSGRTVRWAAILAVLAGGVAACGGDDEVDAEACKGSEQLLAASLLPDGGPYRTRPLPEARAEEIEAGFEVEGARTDTVQVLDSRDKATFVLAAATSLGEEVRSVDVFAGFSDGASEQGGEVQETEMGGQPARLARVQGSTRIVATTGCSAVTLIGIEERPTRELAAALDL